MVKFYDIILLLPLILIIILKSYCLISSKNAVIFWISFLSASITNAIWGNGFITAMTLILSLVILKMLLNFSIKTIYKFHQNKGINCIALALTDSHAVFFDGRGRIEIQNDLNDAINLGKIYIINKKN